MKRLWRICLYHLNETFRDTYRALILRERACPFYWCLKPRTVLWQHPLQDGEFLVCVDHEDFII